MGAVAGDGCGGGDVPESGGVATFAATGARGGTAVEGRGGGGAGGTGGATVGGGS